MVDTIRKMLEEKPNCQKVLNYLYYHWNGEVDEYIFRWACGENLGLAHEELDEALRYLNGGGVIDYEPYIYVDTPRTKVKIVLGEYVSSGANRRR